CARPKSAPRLVLHARLETVPEPSKLPPSDRREAEDSLPADRAGRCKVELLKSGYALRVDRTRGLEGEGPSRACCGARIGRESCLQGASAIGATGNGRAAVSESMREIGDQCPDSVVILQP